MTQQEKERKAIVSVLDSWGVIYKAKEIADEIIGDQTELRKPSEPIGQTDEDLVQKIANLIESDLLDSYAPGFYQDEDNMDSFQLVDLLSSGDTIESGRENIHSLVDSMDCVHEIAKLLPSSRCQENDPPIWYTESEMYDWLVLHDYSKVIAKELSAMWAKDLQGAFEKGWEKAKRENDVNVQLLEALKAARNYEKRCAAAGEPKIGNGILSKVFKAIPSYEKQLNMKYRKLPVEIEAFRYGYEKRPDWFDDAVTANQIKTFVGLDLHAKEDYYCEITTLEGIMTGKCGDFIIKDVHGEIYPCKPEIFAKTYELVENHSVEANKMVAE